MYIRAHAKSLKKAKAKLKELTSRSQGRNVRVVMQKVKVYIRGWLGYFGIASMRTTMQRWDEWLRRRFRCYIWKQWKRPRKESKEPHSTGDTGVAGMGSKQLPESLLAHGEERSCTSGQSRKKDSYRRDITVSLTGTSLCTYAIEPPCTERYARWCERSGGYSDPSYSIMREIVRVRFCMRRRSVHSHDASVRSARDS